jgi:ATP-binding protein involved in chromosome partitioning
VVENMAWLSCPHCDERIEPFGSGGGTAVAEALSRLLGHDVPLLGSVPLDPRLREGGDAGRPLVVSDPDSVASKELRRVADAVMGRPRGLVGRPLPLSPRSA